MARKLRYIGSFRDVSYGVDYDGELFESIADAEAALYERYATHGRRQLRRVETDGEVVEQFYPAVTPEAHILLWPLPTPTTLEALAAEREKDEPDVPSGLLMEDRATIHVWIGRRNAARHGTPEEHEDVERIRKGADVREAGSIVVLL